MIPQLFATWLAKRYIWIFHWMKKMFLRWRKVYEYLIDSLQPLSSLYHCWRSLRITWESVTLVLCWRISSKSVRETLVVSIFLKSCECYDNLETDFAIFGKHEANYCAFYWWVYNFVVNSISLGIFILR